jgi:hypothetical protein
MLLEQIWENIKDRLDPYFKNYHRSLQTIVGAFTRIHLTIDPTLVGAYDPKADAFSYNLWELFFSPVKDAFCVPSHPLKICETLVHEFDHYCYLKEHDMICKTDREYAEFDKTHRFKVEKRAFLSQIHFLRHCKEKAPPHETYNGIRVTGWTERGKPLGLRTQPIAMTKKTTLELIDSMIADCEKVIQRMDSGEIYDEMATRSTLQSCSKIVSILSLPIKLQEKEQAYPSVEIGM